MMTMCRRKRPKKPCNNNMTYLSLHNSGKEILENSGVDEAALDARLLLEYVCGTDRNTLLAHPEREVSEDEAALYNRLIEKRAMRIPLQHITGIQSFMGLDFKVSPDVLIPRADTEVLVEEVMRELHDGMRLLDMCTGSGCILISLLKYSNDCSGTGTDISEAALKLAEENARSIIPEKLESIRFKQGDIFEALKDDEKYDIIVCNPPYIESLVVDSLQPEVKEHDPRIALTDFGDGLSFYRRIIPGAKKFLNGGGRLYFEIGYDQGDAVSRLMQENDYMNIEVIKDYGGNDRVVYGIKRSI